MISLLNPLQTRKILKTTDIPQTDEEISRESQTNPLEMTNTSVTPESRLLILQNQKYCDRALALQILWLMSCFTHNKIHLLIENTNNSLTEFYSILSTHSSDRALEYLPHRAHATFNSLLASAEGKHTLLALLASLHLILSLYMSPIRGTPVYKLVYRAYLTDLIHFGLAHQIPDPAVALAAANANLDHMDGLSIEPPLVYAARSSPTPVITALIRGGANVLASDTAGRTALIVAAAQRRMDVVDAILSCGLARACDVEAAEDALVWCVRSGEQDMKVEFLNKLLDRGVDVNATLCWRSGNKKKGGRKARQTSGNGDVPGPRKTHNNGKTVLMIAASNADLETVQTLLRKKAAVNLRDKGGRTALIWATSADAVDCVSTLLEAHADVNAQDAHDVSALMLAVQRGNFHLVHLLLEARALVDTADSEGATVLMHALSRTLPRNSPLHAREAEDRLVVALLDPKRNFSSMEIFPDGTPDEDDSG